MRGSDLCCTMPYYKGRICDQRNETATQQMTSRIVHREIVVHGLNNVKIDEAKVGRCAGDMRTVGDDGVERQS